ncbi:capsule biosynthesis protein [Gluconobacter albidus]|uniref:capsule biosynthesis protein n=1 Tax=Gluconobacter albidus TaxID=318683 RepID=UPI001FC911B5|nr:capsule biosynthesis protein [Gluconobacter albidus]
MSIRMVELNVISSGDMISHTDPQKKPFSGKVMRWLKGHPGFNLIVLFPTFLAIMYYGCVASPQYVSHAYFVVRGAGAQTPNMLGGLIPGMGGAGSTEDTYAVQTYMMSRDAARNLIQSQNLRAVFNHPDADFFARFPTFFRGNTFEHFFSYYQKHIIAELDTTTGISSLTVRTFSPQDSQRIGRALINAGEHLVNEMNARQRENTIASSQKEVVAAEEKIRNIGLKIADYRNKQNILDPLKQSVPMLRDIDQLKAMLTATRLKVAQVTKFAPDTPLLPVYQRRIEVIKAEIAQAQGDITGSNSSLVPKITEYDDLVTQKEVAERELVTATVSLQAAKVQADRQQLYLDGVAQPDLPDYPEYPHAIADILIVLATGLGVYAMGILLISGAREHQIH